MFPVALLAVGCSTGFAPLPINAAEPVLLSEVAHTPSQPRSSEPVKVTARSAVGVTNVVCQYQLVDPGRYIDLKDPAFASNWISVAMRRVVAGDDGKAAGAVFAVELPGALQTHRRLVRYRFLVAEEKGRTTSVPAADDAVPNFAYFVYDGVPSWSGAINPQSRDPKLRNARTFDTNVMRRVQSYHLISKASFIENVTWREQAGGKEYKYTGTLVSDGVVYDHVRFRARGGVWRYAMGKNMWKIDFNKGHPLQARDDFGQPYREKWSKLNLRACIQQGDYGQRGEQGMFESVGFRLFNLAGVPAPRTHWIQLRIIDEAKENPDDQYRGDFWGLYLAIENEDGHFLKEHGLPDGNVYKMEGGTGTLSNRGSGAVTNHTDLDAFIGAYNRGSQSESWWRTNLDVSRYCSYRSIIECIHHYDVAEGKNYDYYLNPKTAQWIVIPWDIDLTWTDQMYGSGEEPFKRRVLAQANLRHEYQNRLREIRDLLFNPDQSWPLIDECASVIADPSGAPSLVDADRVKWDYHPMMAEGWKAGHGRFYQASPTHNFAGMVQLMKEYVQTRATWIDKSLLNDQKTPPSVAITNTSPAGFPAGRPTFQCAPYSGTNVFAAMKWRLAEITNTNAPAYRASARRLFEINPVWESPELGEFKGQLTLPPNVALPGHAYRVRARIRDNAGRWSHWSAPAEFVAGK